MLARGLLLFAVVALLAAPASFADSDPFAPTDTDNAVKLLVSRINDPASGLKAAWSIDTDASFTEPASAVDKATDQRRLIAPAFANIHAVVPFGWNAGAGAQPQVAAVPSKVRLMIPRDYGTHAVERLIVVAPPGFQTENDIAGNVALSYLRRGYAVVVQNSLTVSFNKTPGSILDLGRRLLQGTQFTLDMLAGFGLPEPQYVYGHGFSRGSNVLQLAVETPGTPFDGIVESNGGSGFTAKLGAGALVKQLVPATTTAGGLTAANQAALHAYIDRIGSVVNVNGVNTLVTSTLTPALRALFGITDANAQLVFPVVPPFDEYGVSFRFTAATFDAQVAGATLAQPVPSPLRSILADVDPSFLADADNLGPALLKEWAAALRPASVQTAIAAIEPTGHLYTKVLKTHGTRDPQIVPLAEIGYVQRVLDAGSSNNLRWYLVKGLGHDSTQAMITFVDKDRNALVNIGRELNDFDALQAWVENGTEPGDLVVADPAIPSARIVAKGAHQVGLQDFPKRYFEQAEALAPNANGPHTTATATNADGSSYSEGTWTNQPVSVHLAGAPGANGAAVRAVYYRLSGAWTLQHGAEATVAVTGEGRSTVSYFSQDVLYNDDTQRSLGVQVDRTAPTVTATGNAGAYTVDQTVRIAWSAADALSGVASTAFDDVDAPAYTFALGAHTITSAATDSAGNTGTGAATFTVGVTVDSLVALTKRFVASDGIANALVVKLEAGQLGAYKNQLRAQSGKALTASDAAVLSSLADGL